MRTPILAAAAASIALLMWSGAAPAQTVGDIPAPRDAPYPGTLTVRVDATDLAHGVFSVHETVPLAAPGPITLLYPKWIPGRHSPVGALDKLAGLVVSADGAPIAWRRNPVEANAFIVDPPAGAKALALDFQFLSPVSPREGKVVMTPAILALQWHTVVLYPAGYFARDITVAPGVVLPPGFAFATALEASGQSEGAALFKPVSLETLVDSPLVAGRHVRRFELDKTARAPVRLDVFADRPEALDATPAALAAHVNLVAQADRLFGARHFAHYDFLLWLSDRMSDEGLEHHQSSENGVPPGYFEDWVGAPAGRDLLGHEYAHSWNGKFRRPADLATPDFQTPMQGSLLWVYEGLTQYWGNVLAARSGLLSSREVLDTFAITAATLDRKRGRAWRSLEDTTDDPVIAQRRPQSWPSWQRSEDYYGEGMMIWLDADTLIRQRSGGRRSLDDFARRFFGSDPGGAVVRPYVLDDLIAAMNAVEPYDWAGFFRARLQSRGPGAPLDGLERGGYRLVFSDAESDFEKSLDARRKLFDLSYAVGMTIGRDGMIAAVDWDGPAYRAGLAAESQVIAVNGEAYDADLLRDAVRVAKSGAPIALLVKTANQYRTVTIDYRGGLAYPHLERTRGATASLDAILTPKS